MEYCLGSQASSEIPLCRRKPVFLAFGKHRGNLLHPRLWKNRFPLTQPSAQV
jgi:hypothetical protein